MTKKTIKNIGILFSVLLGLSLLVKLITPFYWGDSTQTVKFQYYKKNSYKYNAVYLGGSLEFRHIDPAIIDSILQKNGIDFRSFSIAVDGHNIVEQMTDLDGVLKIRNPNLKYIFLSISSESYYFTSNLHTPKWVCWHDATSIYRALSITPTLNDPIKYRAKYSFYYYTSWMENIFKIGLMPDVLNFHLNKNSYDTAYLGSKKNGFYPYDYEENHLFMEYKWEDTLVRASRRAYENDPIKRDSLTNEILKSFVQYKGSEKPNAAMVKLCMDAYRKCAKRGIQVFFILPPRARTNYDLLLPVFHAMPEGSKIEMADPRKYPDYYKTEYGYNFHHLNFKGAKIFSRDLANQLLPFLKAENDAL